MLAFIHTPLRRSCRHAGSLQSALPASPSTTFCVQPCGQFYRRTCLAGGRREHTTSQSEPSSHEQLGYETIAATDTVEGEVQRLLAEIEHRRRTIPGYRVAFDHTRRFPLWEELPYGEMTENGFTHKLRLYLCGKWHMERDRAVARDGWEPVFSHDRYAVIEFDDFDEEGRPRWEQLKDLQLDMKTQLRELFESETEREIEEDQNAGVTDSTSAGASGGMHSCARRTDSGKLASMGYTAEQRASDAFSTSLSRFPPLSEQTRWQRLRFEFAWRYQDIKNQYASSLPTPRSIQYRDTTWLETLDVVRLVFKFWRADMRARMRVTRRKLSSVFKWLYSGTESLPAVPSQAGAEVKTHVSGQTGFAVAKDGKQYPQQHTSGQEAPAATAGEAAQQWSGQDTDTGQQQQQQQTTSTHPPFQPPNMEEFIRDRAALVVSCMNQFIVGYYEGQGRDASEAKLFKQDMFSPDGAPLNMDQLISREKWLDTVSVFARKARELQQEASTIATVKDEDLDLSRISSQRQRHSGGVQNDSAL